MWKVCAAAAAVCLLTANAALAADLKIGIVDFREIVANSEPSKKAKATMEAKFGAERDRLEKQNREVQRLADILKNPGSNPNREALEKTRQDFVRKRQDLDQKARDFGARSEKEEAQLRNEVMDLVFSTAKDFAVKKGFTYLVDANAGIFYADPSFDVTKEFVDEVNRRWKENPSASGGGKK